MDKRLFIDILDKERQAIFKQLFKCLEDKYYLAGGTALALQLRHRQSFDFDLFRNGEVSFALKRKVLGAFKGYKIETLVDTSDELTFVLNEEVKVSLINYFWDPLFPLIRFPGVIPLLSVKDIATTKAYALGRRGNYRDYFDLYVILRQKLARVPDIIKWCKRKYDEVFSEKMFLEQLSCVDDLAKDYQLKFLDEKYISSLEMAKFFIKAIKTSRICQ
ncbi:MAG: nucleotidyl transferase AbiEii/AbiGii toxin family protein [Candidatus Saganbacteria bacterium]|nr:nucleotidyl transferase AbiEii/AbiGii toxin family protein [Candidatus Saganbacteria bacterium]